MLNDIDELLKYKALKNYKLIDKSNIFTCNKSNLKHLFISVDDSDEENE